MTTYYDEKTQKVVICGKKQKISNLFLVKIQINNDQRYNGYEERLALERALGDQVKGKFKNDCSFLVFSEDDLVYLKLRLGFYEKQMQQSLGNDIRLKMLFAINIRDFWEGWKTGKNTQIQRRASFKGQLPIRMFE
jgi:hypothetical protein